jgi:Uma2 family endonuclease
MAPIGGLHIRAVMALTHIFVLAAGARFWVSIQSPLRLDDSSEPEPDLVLLRLPVDRTRTKEPPRAADAALVVEVANTSLQYDKQVKMPLYARHGIPEFWIVDVDAESITVYRSPTHDGYEDSKTYKGTEKIEPLALPGVLIEVADIVTN